ncbi:hypothetical protein SKAU_G00134230 [Synaphobranchus kaupii]|uniref:THAP-type domain-containing protein n=1 Tax=Synaphobranchus kaupii TaxID=118154 RepID=A0A9Q1J1I3_SYNKA|nr:hypothetical protein SKAU_G00134230 [Synaphobranchus kaupii]
MWVQAVKREEGPLFKVTKCTYICSAHFEEGDVFLTPGGLKCVRKDAVPCHFAWANRSSRRKSPYARATERLGSDVREIAENGDEVEMAAAVPAVSDHDYDARPPAGAMDAALRRIDELEAAVRRLSLVQQPQLRRFCVSDEDFRYYTRFPSERIFSLFWQAIEPSASSLVYWSKAQRMGVDAVSEATPSPQRKLPIIDEYFMYSLRTAVGLKEKVLADMFGVSVSTVSRVIITWANYLYLILGSMPIWMTRDQVRRWMPPKFKVYCPHVRVIVDCTELRCETPTALTLHSETYSTYKSHTTFKGLVGVSPSGAVTFVSKLYTGAISDKEITKQSGFIGLLEQGDGVMADKGFLIEPLLETVGASLIIPPFKHRAQFSREETERTQAIARLRILVERVIRRIKEYHIFDSTLPLTLSGSINQIWTNCCVLVNFQGPMELG